MPLKDPIACAAYKAAWYQKTKNNEGKRLRNALAQKTYRKNHRAKINKKKIAYEKKRCLTDPEYREKQRARFAAKSVAARKLGHVKRYRTMHQKARQYVLRSGGALAASDIRYTIDSYRIGNRYLDVYTNELVEKPTIDHIVSIKDGGVNNWTNFAVTSAVENSSKGKKPLLVYLLSRMQRHDAAGIAA